MFLERSSAFPETKRGRHQLKCDKSTAASMNSIHNRRESGQSAVEFALVLPILLLIICGIIEFGMMFAQILSVQNYAREGARYASIHSNDGEGAIELAVENMAEQNPLIRSPSADVDFGTSDVTGADEVTVTLTTVLNALTPIGYLIFGGATRPASATVSMYLYITE